MRRHIEHLKKQPEHVRKQVSFVVAGSVTALIFTLWLFGARDRFSVDMDPMKSALYEQASPLSAVRDTFTNAFGAGDTAAPSGSGLQVIKMEGDVSDTAAIQNTQGDTNGSDTISPDQNSYDGTPDSPVPYYPDTTSSN